MVIHDWMTGGTPTKREPPNTGVSRPRSATSFGMIIGPWSKAMSHYQMASVIVKTGCWAQTIGTVRRCFKRRSFSGRWGFISSYGSDVRSSSYSKIRGLFFGLGVNRWLIAANSDHPVLLLFFVWRNIYFLLVAISCQWLMASWSRYDGNLKLRGLKSGDGWFTWRSRDLKIVKGLRKCVESTAWRSMLVGGFNDFLSIPHLPGEGC